MGSSSGGGKEFKLRNVDSLWVEYDRQNDILYLNFGMEDADESFMVDEDIAVSIKSGYIVGIMIMNFSRRAGL